MPSSTNHRRGHEKPSSRRIRRPKTAPELLSRWNSVAGITTDHRKLPSAAAKLLVKVTIQGIVGSMHVLTSPEATVADLVATSVERYSEERRRPILPSMDPADFNLHYSQFSLERLNREEKMGALGSRNFFLCPKKKKKAVTEDETTSFLPCCKNQAETAAESRGFGCLAMFVDFLFQSDDKHSLDCIVQEMIY